MSNRTEWINRITDQLINPYYTFIENTATYGRKIAKTQKKQRPLMEFQRLLEKVPLLDTAKQLEVYNNYCRDIDCTNLTKNITNCFISNAKVYSSVQDAASKGKRIDLNIPETPRFFYECLIDIARESWEKAYLLNKRGNAIDIQKRVQMSKDLIRDSIAKSIRRLVTDAIVITDQPVIGGRKDKPNDEDEKSDEKSDSGSEVDVQINKQSGGSEKEESESHVSEGAMVVSDIDEPEKPEKPEKPESIKIKFDVNTPHDIKMMKMLDGADKDKESVPEKKSDGVFFDLDDVASVPTQMADEDDIEDDDDPSEVDPKSTPTNAIPKPEVVKKVVKKVEPELDDQEEEESVGGSNVKISKKEFEQFQKLKKFYKTQVEKKKQLELVKQVVQEELQKIKQPATTRAVKRVKKRGVTKSSKCLIDN